MLVKVQMLAFENREITRLVNVPDDEISIHLRGVDPYWFHNYVLERVFFYGQNDFQPQNVCSVSCGDVAEGEGNYYLCCFVGWQLISEEALEAYKKIPRRDRSFVAIDRSFVA